jgi:antitoxin (DNA-binding transcriptional repressor) of toxin-antitoxin stability system
MISQRELCDDNAEIMRRVAAGESFVVARNGTPVADLIPHVAALRQRRPLGQVQALFRTLPPVDAARWLAQRQADDEIFGTDDPLQDAWDGRSTRDT